MTPTHVIIAGSGPGGLCLAQGLKKNGLPFKIYEKDPAFDSRTQGYRIRIDHTGQQALKTCLPDSLYKAFIHSSIPSFAVHTMDMRLTKTKRWVDEWVKEDEGKPADLKTDRLTLRRILMTGITENLEFNKELVDYHSTPDKKTKCFFADGTTEVTDLLVIANGASSLLTKKCFPGTSLIDQGAVCIYGKTMLTEYPKLIENKEGTTIIFDKDIASIIDVMQFDDRYRSELMLPEDYFYWALIGKRSSFRLDVKESLRLDPASLAASIRYATERFPPSLKPLFDQTKANHISVVPVRHSQQGKRAGSTLVTVIGDAIHTMSPAAGLGANTALKDAALLSACLFEEKRDLMDSIIQYEEQMLAYSDFAIAASQRGSALLYNAH